ncbi:F58A4.6 -like [Asbolus verrucosus]|uniref:F58A4.6-like n=1 Tax=Asbolus verrucosus TaxID=1661398 RepID=A0A482VZL9_ASBVE|nr:F58A4.6 -like [Asbolus verrucosus]
MQVAEVSYGRGAERTIRIDCIFFYYLSKELRVSRAFRINLIKTQKSRRFRFILLPTRCNLIDYNWNDRVTKMVRERCELEHALSWLSTLGGAFSALGDYFERCARIAGKISVNQLKLALRLGDPTIASRCWLYFSLSLIQQQRFRIARHIIYEEYKAAKQSPARDERIVRMCKGIWAKLQYEHNIHRSRKKIENISINM